MKMTAQGRKLLMYVHKMYDYTSFKVSEVLAMSIRFFLHLAACIEMVFTFVVGYLLDLLDFLFGRRAGRRSRRPRLEQLGWSKLVIV
jgi:hypothetical protein